MSGIGELKNFIRGESIDNVFLGKVKSKTGSRLEIAVASTTIVAYHAGANIGDTVAIQCPEGNDNKGYILGTVPLSIGEGGNVVI